MPGDDLLIRVGADVGGAETQLRSLGSSVQGLNTHVENASSKSGGLASSLGGLINPATLAVGGIAALGAGLFDTIGKAGAFDEKMASIRATMNPTGAEMQKLNDLALQLGQANDVGSVSASDAANAIFELGKAGISAQDQVNGVAKATLQLAAAAGPEFGVANSASLAADSLNMFGLKANSAKDVVNTLVGASNASSIGLEDMKYGLSAAGAVAHTVGMDFNDTATALAVFGSAGLKGSDAGTSLKTMLMNLQPQSKAASAQMMELGLITKDGSNQFFDSAGHIKSLADISGLLKDKLGGLTEQQRTQALMTMFGSDAVRGASVLFSNGSEGVKKMADAMHQQGDAAKVAADMSNNFKGKMEALGGTIETAQIKIGQQLTPALGGLADMANGLVGGAMNALPGIFDAIGTTFSNVATLAQPLITAIGQFIGSIQGGADPLNAFGTLVQNVGGFIVDLGGKVLQAVGDALPGILAKLGEWGMAFVNWIGPKIPGMLAALANFLGSVLGWVFGTALPALIDKLGEWGKAFIDWIGPRLPGLIAALFDFLGGAIHWIATDALPKIISQLAEWGKAFIDWVGPRIVPLLGELAKILVSIGTWLITTALPEIVKHLVEWGGAFLGWIAKDVIPFLGAKLGEIATALWKWITTTAGDAVKKAAEMGTSIIDGIMNGLRGAADQVKNFIINMASNAVDAIKNFFGIHSPSTVMIGIGQNLMQGLRIGIAQGFPGVVSTLQTGMMDVVNAITPSAFGHGGSIGGGSIGSAGGIFKPVTDGLALIGTTARNIALPGLNDMGGGVHALLDGPIGAFATTMDRTQASSLAGMFVANWDPNAANGFNKYHNTSLHDMGSGLTVFKEGAIAAWHQITAAVTQYTQAVNNAPAYPGQYSGGGGYSGGGSGGGRTSGRPQVFQVVLDRRVIAEAVATDERMSTQASRYAR